VPELLISGQENYGKSDAVCVAEVKDMYQKLKLEFGIGDVSNMPDFTFVENVTHANICAEQALCSDAASVAGKPFLSPMTNLWKHGSL